MISLLQVSHIHKTFSSKSVLRDVSFHVDAGEIVCLLGPSGCGKTTLLRIIAGLDVSDSGSVIFDGRDLTRIAVHKRGFGLMFQDFALFPHKNVIDNVSFGLRMQKLSDERCVQRAREALALVDMSGFETRDVNDLSGGEKQRVALARSLAPRPKLLMLDEPLGSLDRKLREELMNQLRQILRAAGLTSIYVTHDQQEAFAIADHVVIMNEGRIEQIGEPQAVYRYPASQWVARFLGMTNLLDGQTNVDTSVETQLGTLHVEHGRAAGKHVTLLIRPDAALLTDNESRNSFEGTLVEKSFRGGYTRAVIRVRDLELTFEFGASTELPESGGSMRLTLQPNSITVLND